MLKTVFSPGFPGIYPVLGRFRLFYRIRLWTLYRPFSAVFGYMAILAIFGFLAIFRNIVYGLYTLYRL